MFGKDLEHRLADLEYSKDLLETDNEEIDDDIPEVGVVIYNDIHYFVSYFSITVKLKIFQKQIYKLL